MPTREITYEKVYIEHLMFKGFAVGCWAVSYCPLRYCASLDHFEPFLVIPYYWLDKKEEALELVKFFASLIAPYELIPEEDKRVWQQNETWDDYLAIRKKKGLKQLPIPKVPAFMSHPIQSRPRPEDPVDVFNK
jgi:hypothetical protein